MFTIKLQTVFVSTKADSEKVFSAPKYEKYSHSDGSVEIFFTETINGKPENKGLLLSNANNSDEGVSSSICYIENIGGKTIDRITPRDEV